MGALGIAVAVVLSLVLISLILYRLLGKRNVTALDLREATTDATQGDEALQLILGRLRGREALEIGGPSSFFDDFGIYEALSGVDGLNHQETIWQGNVSDSLGAFSAGPHRGEQIIGDAVTDFTEAVQSPYSAILASHVLEHIANPLLALSLWKSKLRPNGVMLLVLPKKEGTFDHAREVTDMSLLIDKYNRRVDEHNLESLPEILEKHDLSRDPPAGTKEEFEARSLRNGQNRALHHHVFDFALLRKCASYIGADHVLTYLPNEVDQAVLMVFDE